MAYLPGRYLFSIHKGMKVLCRTNEATGIIKTFWR